jgi:ABC-type branched-subunit amino acid transport system substrate-binding protein
VTAAQELVSKKVSIVLGSYGSGVSIAAAPTFQSASIPAIGCSCTNPAVTEANPYYFRVCFLDPFQGSVMANFAKDEFSAANAYVLSMLGEDYGSGLATYFVNAFEDLGGTVTSEQFPEGTSDFSAYIQNAINAGADVIFAPCATTYAAVEQYAYGSKLAQDARHQLSRRILPCARKTAEIDKPLWRNPQGFFLCQKTKSVSSFFFAPKRLGIL